MTPGLRAWAERVGQRIADDHGNLRKPQDAGKFLAGELKKSGPLLGGILRGEVEAAFWTRLSERNSEARP